MVHFSRSLVFDAGMISKKRELMSLGNFPGPTIEARSGDELIIDVTNSVVGELAEDGLSFHWHGLAMRGKQTLIQAIICALIVWRLMG